MGKEQLPVLRDPEQFPPGVVRSEALHSSLGKLQPMAHGVTQYPHVPSAHSKGAIHFSLHLVAASPFTCL